MTVPGRTGHGPTGPAAASDRVSAARRACRRATLCRWRSDSTSAMARAASAASMAGHVRGLIAGGGSTPGRSTCRSRRPRPPSRPSASIVPDGPGPGGTAAIAVGGQSYGGRVASLAAAEPDTDYAALVLFSFPLHAPGSPGKAAERTSHLPAIRCPVLFLPGDADPFARMDLLRAAVAAAPRRRARHVSAASATRSSRCSRTRSIGRPRSSPSWGRDPPAAIPVQRQIRPRAFWVWTRLVCWAVPQGAAAVGRTRS